MRHLLKCLLVASALSLSGMSTNAAQLVDLSAGQTGRIEYQSITPPNRWEYLREVKQNTKEVVVYGDLAPEKRIS